MVPIQPSPSLIPNWAVYDAMEKFGGSFARQLSACFRVADNSNTAILLNAFPKLIEQYREKAVGGKCVVPKGVVTFEDGTPRLFIVNDIDRPQFRLAAVRMDGKLRYITMPMFGAMESDRATPLEDFGVRWGFSERLAWFIVDQSVKPSATYPDGKPREWQGGPGGYIRHEFPVLDGMAVPS